MAVRNSQELGANLFNVAMRLLKNQNLCKYLKYTDSSPLDHADFTDTISEILHKNIKVVPLVNVEENSTESTVVLVYEHAPVEPSNTDFDNVTLAILIYTPLREWALNSTDLRPFLIISEIEKSLKNKRIDGLGNLKYQGWGCQQITDEYSCHRMEFRINAFD